MGVEIERKFLVRDDGWRKNVVRAVVYRQAYLDDGTRGVSVRVRIAGRRANLNIKSGDLEIRRLEFEYDIPLADAEQLVALCRGAVVEKTRHFVDYDRHTWEIDVFGGRNAGLVVAEIELQAPDERFARPPWLGAEVSDDPRFYNVSLATHPYCEWSPASD